MCWHNRLLTSVNMRWIYLPQCTTYDLLEKGMEVHIVADAVSSRRYFSVRCFFFLLLCSCGNCITCVFVLHPKAKRTVCLPSPGWSRAALTSPPQRLFCCSWFKTPNTPTLRRCLLHLLSVLAWNGSIPSRLPVIQVTGFFFYFIGRSRNFWPTHPLTLASSPSSALCREIITCHPDPYWISVQPTSK